MQAYGLLAGICHRTNRGYVMAKRTDKQKQHAKWWRSHFTFGTGSAFPDEEEPRVKFDCSVCGDPTYGSYNGAIISNMCWDCNDKHKKYTTKIGDE